MASAPTPSEPLSIDQAKLHLRVDTDDSDDLIDALIVAAREYVEDYTGLILTPRLITETAARLGDWIELASWPISSVDAVRYPLNGALTPLAPGSWLLSLNRRPVRLVPATWGWGVGRLPMLSGNLFGRGATLPVEIDVSAGYATPDEVPQTVKQAMLLLIQSWFDNRSAVEAGLRAAAIEVPFTVDVLLRKHRLACI